MILNVIPQAYLQLISLLGQNRPVDIDAIREPIFAVDDSSEQHVKVELQHEVFLKNANE